MNRTARTSSSAEIDATASDWIVRRDSGLSEAEQSDFARWQAADPRHAEAVARHDRAWAMLDRPRSGGRAGEMLREFAARASRRRRRRLRVAAAACVGLFAVGAVWQAGPPATAAASLASAVVRVPEKQTLPDGTVVELKTGAEIAVDYAGKFRRVALRRGEALFHVAPDKARAFIVTAAGVDVRAVGTAFMVEVAGAAVDVIVTEGQVAVSAENRRQRTEDGGRSAAHSTGNSPASVLRPLSSGVLVEAGKRILVEIAPGRSAPQVTAISSADIADRLEWRAARLEFSDTPMAEAVALMNRHAKVRLIVDDPELARVPVSGLFRADNTATLIRLLEANFGVKAERAGETIVLRKAR